MPADVAFLDWTQTLLGPALALRQRGLQVRYFSPDVRAQTSPLYRKVLLERYFGGGDREPCFTARHTVYAESFADGWWALRAAAQLEAPLYRDDPWLSSIHPMQAEARFEAIADRLAQVDRLTVVDMSDLAGPHHPVFLDLPGRKWKREVARGDTTPAITPFPFLYNPVLLALDEALGLEACAAPPGPPVRDGWFCGTIDHARYGGARRRALETMVARHPGARFEIHGGGIPTLENLREVQRSRTLLHPPGRGTICFRTHEALRFGVPLLVADRPEIRIGRGLEACFIQSLANPGPDPNTVLRTYAAEYAPAVAAELLQDSVPTPTYDGLLATTCS